MIRKKNKKGFLLDLIFIVIVMFIIGLVIFFCGKILTDSNTSFQQTLFSNQSKQEMQDNTDRYNNVFDNVFLTISILLLITIIINITLLQANPALIIFLFIIFCFSLIPIAIMGNAFNDISTDTNINSFSTGFTFTNWIMSHIVLIILGFGTITTIVLFAKFQGD